MPLNIAKSIKMKNREPFKYTVTLEVEGQSTYQSAPLYIVFVMDATPSMAVREGLTGRGIARFQVALEAVEEYLQKLSSSPYKFLEKNYALVSFGNGARVHVSAADAAQDEVKNLLNPHPCWISAGGLEKVQDHYIGANSDDPREAAAAFAKFEAVEDKSRFFYKNPQEFREMVRNISRFENTNGESGLLLAGRLLKAAPASAHKMVIFITDGESNTSSTFYTYYHQAPVAATLAAAEFVREEEELWLLTGGLKLPVRREDMILSGLDPVLAENSFTGESQKMELKLRTAGRSLDFFRNLTDELVINPFAGEWHNFDGINNDAQVIRVADIPDFQQENDVKGYFWSGGLPLDPVFPQGDIHSCKLTETCLIDYDQRQGQEAAGSRSAKRLLVAAGRQARQQAVHIKAVGIGSGVKMVNPLDRLDSCRQASVLDLAAGGGPAALTGELLDFTERVLHTTNDLEIHCEGGFMVDRSSCRAAYFRESQDTAVYMPVRYDDDPRLSLVEHEAWTAVRYAPGPLWSEAAAAGRPERCCRVIFAFDILPATTDSALAWAEEQNCPDFNPLVSWLSPKGIVRQLFPHGPAEIPAAEAAEAALSDKAERAAAAAAEKQENKFLLEVVHSQIKSLYLMIGDPARMIERLKRASYPAATGEMADYHSRKLMSRGKARLAFLEKTAYLLEESI